MMKTYLIVVAKKGNMYKAIMSDEQFQHFSEPQIFNSEKELVAFVGKDKNLTPYNFSIKDLKIVEDAGKFSRLTPYSYIVIGEWVTKGGKTLGYKLFNYEKKDYKEKVATQYIVERQKKMGDTVLLQNGIIRDNAVACFSNHQFPQIVYETAEKAKVQSKITGKQIKAEEDEFPGFTEEQKKELRMYRKRGGDIRLIYNNKLSPEQMRVLWLGKTRGQMTEVIANPEIPVESMKFYAKRLVSEVDSAFYEPFIKTYPTAPRSVLDKLKNDFTEAKDYKIPLKPCLGSVVLEEVQESIRKQIEKKKSQNWGFKTKKTSSALFINNEALLDNMIDETKQAKEGNKLQSSVKGVSETSSAVQVELEGKLENPKINQTIITLVERKTFALSDIRFIDFVVEFLTKVKTNNAGVDAKEFSDKFSKRYNEVYASLIKDYDIFDTTHNNESASHKMNKAGYIEKINRKKFMEKYPYATYAELEANI